MGRKKTFEFREKIILRDYLALERTRLANERTLFSYIRTCLYLVIAGIAFIQLKEFASIKWLGYFSFAVSLVVLITGLINYLVLRKKLLGFYNPATYDPDAQSR